MATPALNASSPAAGAASMKGPGRRLRLEEILTPLQADGLVAAADAEALALGPGWSPTPVAPPPPVVTALVPDTAVIGSPSFTLHVHGTGFAPDAVIVFNGYDEPTTIVSPTEVTTGVNMAVWTAPSAPLPVAVRNPDGVVSNDVPFTFTEAAP